MADIVDLFVLFPDMKMLLIVDSSVIERTRITCNVDRLKIMNIVHLVLFSFLSLVSAVGSASVS